MILVIMSAFILLVSPDSPSAHALFGILTNQVYRHFKPHTKEGHTLDPSIKKVRALWYYASLLRSTRPTLPCHAIVYHIVTYPEGPSTQYLRSLAPKNHTLTGIKWDQSPSTVGTWTLWDIQQFTIRYYTVPRGSRYLILKDLELQDHDSYGFWGLSP